MSSYSRKISQLGYKKPTKTLEWQLEVISLYLQSGYSIYDIVELGLVDIPKQDGQQFVIADWLTSQGLKIIRYLLDFLPLDKAIDCYLKISLFQKKFKKKLLKIMLYPGLQLILAFCLSLLAQRWVLPLLGELMSDMAEDSSVGVMGIALQVINYGLLVLIVLAVIAWVVSKVWEKSFIYIILDLPLLRSVKKLLVYQFINYYLIFYEMGDAIEVIINGLRKLPDSGFINHYADQVHFKLLSGDSLPQAMSILDKRLTTIFKIGRDTGKGSELLASYGKGLNLELQGFLKRLGRYFQVFSYVYIMLLVLLVYQMMLMPLALIERM